MSTFCGKITEIPGISIDNFTEINWDSSVYFLSHCHTDHMPGLGSFEFQNNIILKKNVYLYASSISIQILQEIYPKLKTKLKCLSMYGPTLINLPNNNENITVTPLPAGHCPGSIMFFFETKTKKVLYTGDFRLSEGDIEKFKCFHDTKGMLKVIDKIYLDTTFLSTSYSTFPSREKSSVEICSLIQSWIKKSLNHIICLYTSARYGSENLFIDIFRQVGMKIHIDHSMYKIYSQVKEIEQAVTLDPTATQIHCCRRDGKICISDNAFLRTIRPSALYWKNKNLNESIVETNGRQFYYVCYSCHGSLNEIKYVLQYLKPKDIYPCVNPNLLEEQEAMNKLLKQILNTYKETENLSETDSEEYSTFNMSGTAENSSKETQNSISSEDELFSSPKRKRQK